MNKLIRKIAFGFLISGMTIFPVVSLFATAPLDKLPIKKTIVVDAPKVDASCLIGENVPPALKEQLKNISIGIINAPLGGLELDRSQMIARLGPLSERFEIPKRMQILRKGEILAGTEVAKRITEAIKSRLGDTRNVEVDLSRLPDHIVLPGKALLWTISPMSTNNLGMVLFTLEADCEGGKHRQILQAEVWQVMKAAKIQRLMTRGEVIGPADIMEEDVKVKNLSQKGFISFDRAIGKKISVYKSPGSFLRISDVNDDAALSSQASAPVFSIAKEVKIGKSSGRENRRTDTPSMAFSGYTPHRGDNWVIRPGETVDFQVKNGGLILKVPAKALEGGCVGDPIRLVNLQNNRNIEGIITGEGQVEYGKK